MGLFLSKACIITLAIPQLRSARSAASFLNQGSLLTAARARQAAASDGDASGALTGAGVIDAPLANVDATFVDIVLRTAHARAALPLHALAPPHVD
jgi:hypothetical protein